MTTEILEKEVIDKYLSVMSNTGWDDGFFSWDWEDGDKVTIKDIIDYVEDTINDENNVYEMDKNSCHFLKFQQEANLKNHLKALEVLNDLLDYLKKKRKDSVAVIFHE